MMEPSNTNNDVKRESQLDRTQKQVDEVVTIMKTNVDRIIDRDGKLNELDERANNLNLSASEFQTTSRKIKRKYWWKNIKMMIIMALIVLIILIVIIVSCLPSSSDSAITTTTTLPPISPTP